jgi:hypothetical protein
MHYLQGETSVPPATKKHPEKMGYEDYLLHGGEAESRLTQNRMKLSDAERRQYFPYQKGDINYGLDINPDDAIISTQHPRSINNPSESMDFSKIRSLLSMLKFGCAI